MNKQIFRNIVFIGLFFIPFVPFLISGSFFFPFITTKVFTWRIIVEIVFAAWIPLALLLPQYRLKKSSLLYTLGIFLLIVTLADVFGVAPVKSIWSNFERMEGLLTMLHLGALFVVMSSVFDEADWKRWWNVSLVASFLMVLYCTLQILGVKTINQGGVRVDGTLGNAIYLAVYMLFHIFIALLYMFHSWKDKSLRYIYGFLILCQLIVLYYTATRGAILGLIGGLVIFALLNLKNREDVWVRKISIAIIAGLVILGGGFFAVRNASFVQKSPVLSRFANINLSELQSQGRYYIWPMALEGIKERPILGWGQENFNYVFQEHYNSAMYNLEPWFDRAHNVFLDWAIAGGLLALIAYSAFYVLALQFIWRKGNFSYLEKTVLVSLLAAYFFHNLFVFDNLVSYVLFFALLAYLHGRSNNGPLWQRSVSPNIVRNIAVPAASVMLIICLYFLNWEPIVANTSLINALRYMQGNQVALATNALEKSYSSSILGRQEEVEQMITYSTQVLSSSAPIAERNKFFEFAKTATLEQAKIFPNDTRYQLLAGIFFGSTGDESLALSYLQKAEKLAPNKQDVYFELAQIYISHNEPQKALEPLRRAYELAPSYSRAKVLYFVDAIYANDRALENELRNRFTEHEFAFDDTIASAYYGVKRFNEVIAMLETRKRLDPANINQYDQLIQQLRSQK